MKTLKNLLLAGTLALSGLFSGCNSEIAPVRAGFELGSIGTNKFSVDVPGRCVPEYPDNIYRKHNCILGKFEIGPRVQLFSFLDAGVNFNLGQFKFTPHRWDYLDNNFETYWGGYGIGDYACIGIVESDIKMFSPSYDLTLQSPLINLVNNETGEKKLGLGGFISLRREEFDMTYKSGYHMYEEAFYKTYDQFKIGHFELNGIRYGIRFDTNISGHSIIADFFYQSSSIDGNLIEEAKDFKYQKNLGQSGFDLKILF